MSPVPMTTSFPIFNLAPMQIEPQRRRGAEEINLK